MTSYFVFFHYMCLSRVQGRSQHQPRNQPEILGGAVHFDLKLATVWDTALKGQKDKIC